MRYRFHVHKRLRHWRLVLAEGAPPPDGCVIDDWIHSRTREHDDTNADVREQVGARGYSLFRLGGGFADVARELQESDQSSAPNPRASLLGQHPVHLGVRSSAVREPAFTGGHAWFEDYVARHAADAGDAWLVTSFTFDGDWDIWEMHPRGSEVVLCTLGEMTLVQELDGEPVHTPLRAGQYAINAPGVWHTADAEGEVTAVFITAGIGTAHRAR